MEVSRTAENAALIHLDHDEVRELLGAFALSMGAYGILQNFMTLNQKSMTLPSLAFMARLGTLLAADEDFQVDDRAGEPAAEPDEQPGEDAG
jgi:hypothetical protein